MLPSRIDDRARVRGWASGHVAPRSAKALRGEAVHRLQASAFPSCEAFVASLVSARQVIAVELPAYCAQWRIAVGQGADSVEMRRDFGWRIAAQSGAMENRLEVVERFKRECAAS